MGWEFMIMIVIMIHIAIFCFKMDGDPQMSRLDVFEDGDVNVGYYQ